MRNMRNKLRIAFSVVCGILCLLLIALWVESFWSLRYLDTRCYRLQVTVATLRGVLGVNVDTNQTSSGPGTPPQTYWHFGTFPSSKHNYGLVTDGFQVISFLGFRWVCSNSIYESNVPFWFLTLAVALTSALPWIRWRRRFSLRTLMIAMTLMGLVLGAIVYALS
jgi:hypothetical protein